MDKFDIGGEAKLTLSYDWTPRRDSRPNVDLEGSGDLFAHLFGFKVWAYPVSFAKFHLYPSTSAGASVDGQAVADVAPVFVPELVSREYLQSQRRSNVRSSATVQASSVRDGQATAIETAVFPHSASRIDGNDGVLGLAYVTDNPLRLAVNRTQFVAAMWGGQSWLTAQPVADDGTADFHPRLRMFADGSAMAIWENVNRVLPDSATYDDVKSNLDIAAALYDPAQNRWSAATSLSTNGYLDSNPRVVGATNDNVLATWIGNPLNSELGTPTAPNTVWAARWNGVAWSAPQAIATIPHPIVGYDAAYDGVHATIVLSVDLDDNMATIDDHELFRLQDQGAGWLPLERLTTDSIADDHPQMVSSDGGATLVWLKGDALMTAPALNLAQSRLVRTLGYSSQLADFRLVSGREGSLAILWVEPGKNVADVRAIFYDPIFGLWGDARTLTSDVDRKTGLAGGFDAQHHLNLVYDNTITTAGSSANAAAPGLTDLVSVQKTLGVDLAIAGSSLGLQVNPDRSVGITATIVNLGEVVVQGPPVAFYDGDPARGGELIGTAQLSDPIAPGMQAVARITWSPRAGRQSADIYAVVDPDDVVGDRDRTNNSANSPLGRPDLTIAGRPIEVLSPTLMQVTARVSNVGVAQSPATLATFRSGSQAGAIVRSVDVPALAPGASFDASFSWDTSAVAAVPGVVAAIVDEAKTVSESDELNNTSIITVGCSYQLGSGPVLLSPQGGQTVLTLVVSEGCGWTVATTVPWITVTSSRSGTSSGQVVLSVAPNPGRSSRQGELVLGGQSLVATQTAVIVPTPSDFDGDGKSDLVWRNYATGDNSVWFMRGNTILRSGTLPKVLDLNWQLVAVADWNNDGHPDLIWRNAATGDNAVWYMNGVTLLHAAGLPTVSDLNWEIAVAADLDGDGHADLVWRNRSTGGNAVWHMNDVTLLTARSLPSVPDLNWQLVAAADIDGGGTQDLLWRNKVTGDAAVWYMRDVDLMTSRSLPLIADTNWRLVGALDIDGDAVPDLLWRNSVTGADAVWYMNDTTLLSSASLTAVADRHWRLPGSFTPRTIALAGNLDFGRLLVNTNATRTLTIRNPSGVAVSVDSIAFPAGYTGNWSSGSIAPGGSQIVTVTFTPPAAGTYEGAVTVNGDYTSDAPTLAVAGVGIVANDLTGAGRPGLVWRNIQTGENAVWTMNGAAIVRSASLPTVTDLNWQFAAIADLDGDGQPDLVWRNRTSGADIVWFMNGTAVVSSGVMPSVSDLNWAIVAAADIDGDGRADLIWRNGATGDNAIWYMNGATLVRSVGLSPVPDLAWQIVAAADLDGDGHPDLIWRHAATGANVVWYMNGSDVVASGDLPAVADRSWQLVAVVDLDGDGHPDFLWRRADTGANVVWFMNNRVVLRSAASTTVADTHWRLAGLGATRTIALSGALAFRSVSAGMTATAILTIANTGNDALTVSSIAYPSGFSGNWSGGTIAPGASQTVTVTFAPAIASSYVGVIAVSSDYTSGSSRILVSGRGVVPYDLNGDGQPDLVWRNTANGSNVVWYMNGTTLLRSDELARVTDQNWQIVATADIDGDGKPDLIWRNRSTGSNAVWYMNGATIRATGNFANVGDQNWQIVGAADIDGDGHPDLIWRNTSTGDDVVWYLDGTTLLRSASLPGVVDANWKIVAIADINTDGHPDLVWRNTSSGAMSVWFLNGTSVTSSANLPTVADLSWQVVGAGDFNSDGHPDLVWRNSTSGANVVWIMDGLTVTRSPSLSTVADLTWTLRFGG